MNISPKLTSHDYRYVHLFVAFAGLLIFYHIRWGLGMLDPRYINWVIENTELGFGYFSFGYFRHQPWGFPLGKIDYYFYPLGVNVFTSDIPLLALLFKPFSYFLPAKFQYLGIWYFTCHLLQAWFAILLCERLGIRGISKFLVVVFLLLSPILLIRFIHPNLFCQWMILAALWIYFLEPGTVPVRKILGYQLILFVVSGLEFGYMWAMIFGFSVALFLRLWLIDKKLKFLSVILHFSLHMGIMVILWLLIGLFSFEGIPNYQAEGWGAFTMNLNSWYNPMNTGSILPTLPFLQAQRLEGYNYLGAGILLLMVICVASLLYRRFSASVSTARRKIFSMDGIDLRPLLLFLVFSTLFSLSNKISFNDRVILEYPLSDSFAGIVNSFRSSGRFFWPAYYFLFIALFYHFTRLPFPSVVKSSALAGCLLVQLYDIKFFFEPQGLAYSENYTPPINNAIWEKVITSFDAVLFYPGFQRSFLSPDDYRYFTYFSVIHQKKINMGYIARFDVPKAASIMAEIGSRMSTEGLDEHNVYISSEPYLNRLILPLVSNDAHCFTLDNYLIFFKKTESTKSLAGFLEKNVGPESKNKITSHITMNPWTSGPKLKIIGDAKMGFYEIDNSDDHFFLKGWAFSTPLGNMQGDSLQVVLESVKSKRHWISPPAYRFGTQDVADYFGNPNLTRVGFSTSQLKSNLPSGSYRTGLLFSNQKSGTENLYWLDHVINVYKTAAPFLIDRLHPQTEQVKFDINKLEENPAEITIESWAFPSAGYCGSCRIFYSLTSPARTYAVEGTSVSRPDVASYFKDSTLLRTGLNVKFRKSALERGSYHLGILFRDTVQGREYYADTHKIIDIGMDGFVDPVDLQAVPTGSDTVLTFLDRLIDLGESYEIEGWGFIKDLSNDSTRSYLVLKSDSRSYQLYTHAVERTDVRDHFKLKFEMSNTGYKVKVKKEKIDQGTYTVCILIENLKSHQSTLTCSNQTIQIEREH